MGKNFGSVALGDDDRLGELAREANVYLDASEVWAEAKAYMEANAADEAEVRVRGLDYIEVYK